jgi:hypothetical protein
VVSASVQDEADRDINDWVTSLNEAPIQLNKTKKVKTHTKIKITETDESVDSIIDQKANPSSQPKSKARKRYHLACPNTHASYQDWDKFDVDAEVEKVEAEESRITTENSATNPIDDRIRYKYIQDLTVSAIFLDLSTPLKQRRKENSRPSPITKRSREMTR